MKTLILLLTVLSFYPQDSMQMNLFSKSSTISTSCNYSYDLQNRYICDLQSPLYTSPNDVLEITGTHLDGNADVDVIAVNYYSNVTSYFNGEVLAKFENLKFLYFYGSGIQEFGNNSFKVCPKLETIHGTLSNLTSFPSKLFENCENLKVFNFFAQNVQEVPEDLFGMTKNLEKFKFNTFKVTSLPEKLLQNMENLRIFDINANKLTELSPNLLIAAVNLEEVDVSFNEFEDQWKVVYALNGHPNLKKLYMKYNRFTDFDFRFFSQFQKLETLEIDSWRSNFSQISWQSLPSSMLYLNVDRIGEEIPENAFDRLVNLKELILSGSGIENLHKDTFKALTNLEDLEVTSTNIKTLHPELFMSLTSLSDLNLGYNQIEELPIGIFAPLVNLGHKSEFDGLKMPINKISRLNANSFGLHPHLRYIRFYQNAINEIEKGIFSKFHSNLTNVDFKYNTCVNGIFSGDNLDDNEAFSECHKNWIEIIPTTTEEVATTPGGAEIYPHLSLQQAIISKSSLIQATCVYNYTSNNIYSCDLFVSTPVNSTSDVLEITGTHLANHTDDDVESVSHGSNIGAYFNGEVLRKFVNLKRIGIFEKNLTEINPNAFDVCPKLETLVISYGKLTSFPPGMLKNCQNLKYFETMATKIETFPEDFFGDTKNLETFYAAVNQLKSLPEKLLQNMSNLKVFRVGYNKLTELSSNFFINSPNLEEVSAYNNEFRNQNDIAFALNGRTNLRILWLDENKFTNFDFRFFAQFQKLEYLSIGNRWDTKLTNIHWQSLPASLIDLKVYGPDADIPENAFERTTNLRTLTLYGNSITNFQKDTFKSLTSLVYLYLYDTGLKTLHPEQFTSQGNLSNLLISDSQLEELPAGIFVPLVNIGNVNQFNSIQISYSKIRRLNANSFGQHPHLRNIEFIGNEINEIERGIFSKFHPNMVFVALYDNICINEYLSGENLDNHEKLELCFKNWEEIDPNNTTVAPPTTPGGSGTNFKSFEVITIILVGIFKIFVTKFNF